MSADRNHLACAICNADLASCDLAADCPRCNTPIAATINLDAVDPATRTVNANVLCLTCSYNLLTLPVQAPCPECATPAAVALRPDNLTFADRSWLRTVSSGINLGLVALSIFIAERFLWGSVLAWARAIGVSWKITFGAGTIVMLSYVLLGILAVLRITAPEPVRFATSGVAWPRRVALFLPLVPFLVFVVVTLNARLLPTDAMKHLSYVVLDITVVSVPVSLLAVMLLLRRLAGRERRSALAGAVRVIMIVLVVLAATALAWMAIDVWRMYASPSPFEEDVMFIARSILDFAEPLMYGAAVLLAVLLLRYRRLLGAARARAAAFATPPSVAIESTASCAATARKSV